MKTQPLAATFVAAAAVFGAGAAQAQVAGSLSVKVGVNKITPHVESGDLSAPAQPGSKIDIKSASSAIVTATYMWTDSVSLEFFGGLPYKHNVVGAGSAAGVGKIGSLHQVSPTVLLQYRFLGTGSRFRPYVGAGLTYAIFYGAQGSGTLTALTNPGGPPTKIGSDRSLGTTFQVGTTVSLDPRWYLDLAAMKTYISASTRLSTGQSTSAKLDPVSTSVALGYHF